MKETITRQAHRRLNRRSNPIENNWNVVESGQEQTKSSCVCNKSTCSFCELLNTYYSCDVELTWQLLKKPDHPATCHNRIQNKIMLRLSRLIEKIGSRL